MVRFFTLLPGETQKAMVDSYMKWSDGELEESLCKTKKHSWEEGAQVVGMRRVDFYNLLNEGDEEG